MTTVGFDADDTLWHDAKYFAEADGRLKALVHRALGTASFDDALILTHRKNLAVYGMA